MMFWGDWGWGWMVVMMVLMVVFWGGIIALIIWAISRFFRREVHSETSYRSHDALDIAKERYARGEITKEQFEQIKKDLS